MKNLFYGLFITLIISCSSDKHYPASNELKQTDEFMDSIGYAKFKIDTNVYYLDNCKTYSLVEPNLVVSHESVSDLSKYMVVIKVVNEVVYKGKYLKNGMKLKKMAYCIESQNGIIFHFMLINLTSKRCYNFTNDHGAPCGDFYNVLLLEGQGTKTNYEIK